MRGDDMAKIRIGTVYSFRAPERWTFTPDDRQQKIELIDGVVVEDCNYIPAGDTISCSALFKSADFAVVRGYWTNRTRVTVADEVGNVYSNVRVLVKSYHYESRFPSYVNAEIEFWFA